MDCISWSVDAVHAHTEFSADAANAARVANAEVWAAACAVNAAAVRVVRPANAARVVVWAAWAGFVRGRHARVRLLTWRTLAAKFATVGVTGSPKTIFARV